MAAPTKTASPSGPPDTELRSTWPQRAWTLAGSVAILSSLLTCFRLAAGSGSVTELIAVPMAVVAAYSLADLTTGVYHWLIDNYGDADTPVFGAQITNFQDHHRHPSTIARLEPCNNLHVLAGVVAVVLPAIDAALSARGCPAAAHAFACTFAACVMLSVQFHAWAHEKPARLPPGVKALQAAGVLVSHAQHAGHHRPPFNTNYCTVSGMWNRVLDSHKVFDVLEKVIYLSTGFQPRSWGEPAGARRRDDAAATQTSVRASKNPTSLYVSGFSATKKFSMEKGYYNLSGNDSI